MMEYHRPQLKRSAKAAMAETRPRAWLITILFLLLGAAVTGLFSFLSPEPFGGLGEPISEALEAAVDYVSGTGDVDRALEEFQYVLEDELRDEFMDYVGGNLLAGLDEDVVTGFLFHLLAGSVLTGLVVWLLSTVASLINVVLDHGYRSYCLGVFRRQDPSVGKLFSAFPRILTVLGSHIMVSIFTFLWTLLAMVAGGVLIFLSVLLLPEEAAVIVSVILYLAMLTFIVAFALRYALTPYIVVENREMGVFDAIRHSKKLMKGNRLRLFILELSFLGWDLLIVGLVLAVLLVGVLIAALVISVSRSVLIGSMVIVVAAGAAALISLPLELWLMAYRNICAAGFYHIVSFPPEAEPVMEPVAAGAAIIPDMPVWANAPEEEILPPCPEEPAGEAPAEEEAAAEAAPETGAETETPAEEPIEDAPAEEPSEEEPPEATEEEEKME